MNSTIKKYIYVCRWASLILVIGALCYFLQRFSFIYLDEPDFGFANSYVLLDKAYTKGRPMKPRDFILYKINNNLAFGMIKEIQDLLYLVEQKSPDPSWVILSLDQIHARVLMILLQNTSPIHLPVEISGSTDKR